MVADDTTRILAAEETARLDEEWARPSAPSRAPRKPPAARPAQASPQIVGDKIVFFCPNGHRIVVDRAWAGKRGTCSKAGCNAPVVIPTVPGVESPTEVASPPAIDAPGEQRPDAAASADAEQDAPPAATETGDTKAQSADAPTDAPPAADGWNFDASAAAAGDALADVGFDPGAEAAGWGIDIDEIENPTARLVARLWLERAHGGIVEVHLAGGSVIMPEWYEPRWSGGTHALFASQAADGTVTLTAVAWDQVQKVVVRQVQGTPDGMFEG